MFTNGNNTPVTFANYNAKSGNFVVAKKGEEKQYFSQLRDVRLKGVAIKEDEFEGQPVHKLRLTLEGDGERAVVDFNMATYAAAKLAGCLIQADPGKPIGLLAQLKKAGSSYKKKDGTMSEPLASDFADIAVFQDGKAINLAEGHQPPKTHKVLVGKKEVTDTTERDEWIVARVAELVAKTGSSSTAHHEAHEASSEMEIPLEAYEDHLPI